MAGSGLPVLVLRAADGLAVDGDYQTAPDLHGPGPEPGTEDLIEPAWVKQGEGPPERGLLRRAAAGAQDGQHVLAGIGGPLPDRGERPGPGDHRRDPDGQQPGQRMPASAPLPRVGYLGKEIEKVVAAGSRDRRRWHRRAGPSRQTTGSAGTSIVPPGPRLPSADTPDTSPAAMKQQLTASFHDFAVSLLG